MATYYNITAPAQHGAEANGGIQLLPFVRQLHGLTDERDNRGKRHKLAFVLGGVVLAIMSGRSYPSSIQRFIHNRLRWLRRVLGEPTAMSISRAHLPRLLAQVDWASLNVIVMAHFGVEIVVDDNAWYALDGKTLRGVPGSAERLLLAVEHTERQTVAQQPMQGPKTSEVTAARELLATTGLEHAKVTLDALHFTPDTTAQVNQAAGQFIIQLKDNQPLLVAQMEQVAAETVPVTQIIQMDKGHGRHTVRHGIFFDIRAVELAPRWAASDLATLIVLARRTHTPAKNKIAAEVSLYLSNTALDSPPDALAQELFTAIRRHWGVESENFIRDTTFQEDYVKTKDANLGQVLACLRTLAIRLFRDAHLPNFRAALEYFSDCPDQFEDFLHQYGFL